jgi:hypothetical protein
MSAQTTQNGDYADFIRSKVPLATSGGFEVADDEINPLLKPHQRACVAWAVRGGRRALFESFGLGKTFQQLEILRLILKRLGGGRALVVAPLGVRQEFRRDAAKLGLSITFVRRSEEVEADGLFITNYESVRDGRLDPYLFDAVSLDEASCLRGFGGTKTFREFMALFAGDRKTPQCTHAHARHQVSLRRDGHAKPQRIYRASGLLGLPRHHGCLGREDPLL